MPNTTTYIDMALEPGETPRDIVVEFAVLGIQARHTPNPSVPPAFVFEVTGPKSSILQWLVDNGYEDPEEYFPAPPIGWTYETGCDR